MTFWQRIKDWLGWDEEVEIPPKRPKSEEGTLGVQEESSGSLTEAQQKPTDSPSIPYQESSDTSSRVGQESSNSHPVADSKKLEISNDKKECCGGNCGCDNK